MKLVLIILTLSLSILMSGCATISVDYDYDAGFDFSSLNRYSWLEMPIDYPVNQLSAQRVKAAVDQQLKDKGFSLTTGSADFLVSLQGYKGTVRQYPQTGSPSKVSGLHSESEQFQQGMFTIMIVETKRDRLIWQGHAKGVASPGLSTEDRVKKLNEAVAKLFANFPPNN